jgi:hypothetical protein
MSSLNASALLTIIKSVILLCLSARLCLCLCLSAAVVGLLLIAVLASATGHSQAQIRHLRAHAATDGHIIGHSTAFNSLHTERPVSEQPSRVHPPLRSFQTAATIAAQPGSSSSSSRRELQQAQAVNFNNLELPR